MHTRSARGALLARRTTGLVTGVVVAAVLTACGSQAPPPGAEPSASTAPGAGGPSDPGKTEGDGAATAAPDATEDPGGSAGAGDSDGSGSEGSEGSAGSDPAGDSTDGPDDTGDDGSRPLEMPEATETEVQSLSELVGTSSTAPLVRAPLPGAASARGRLVAGYPAALRPTRASRIGSSSVSPSGDRLQVALVGTTTLSAPQVLLAYRSRLARRGLVERATPPTVAGSRAAAFRRGSSVVTVTVTPDGSRTAYVVQATLRAGRG